MPTPLVGNRTMTGISSAVQVSTTPVNVSAWILKAPITNSGPVFIGPAGVTSTTGHAMDPGDSQEYERTTQNTGNRYELSPQDVWAAGTSGDILTWFGSPA